MRTWQDRQKGKTTASLEEKPDLIEQLRELTRAELIGTFADLRDKYSRAGICMRMDASDLLSGGREINFELAHGEYRLNLFGTVTSESIAFRETRYTPTVDGELTSGPKIRLKHLNAEMFRNFICERLAILLRAVMHQRTTHRARSERKSDKPT